MESAALLPSNHALHGLSLLIDKHNQVAAAAADVIRRAIMYALHPAGGRPFFRDRYQRIGGLSALLQSGFVGEGNGACHGHDQLVLLHCFERRCCHRVFRVRGARSAGFQ